MWPLQIWELTRHRVVHFSAICPPTNLWKRPGMWIRACISALHLSERFVATICFSSMNSPWYYLVTDKQQVGETQKVRTIPQRHAHLRFPCIKDEGSDKPGKWRPSESTLDRTDSFSRTLKPLLSTAFKLSSKHIRSSPLQRRLSIKNTSLEDEDAQY